MDTIPAILLFAAGASRRMAPRDKLTEVVDGEPLLRRTARRALATGHPVIALLPPDRPARAAALDGLDLGRVTVPDAGAGMSRSIRAGIAALPPDCPGAMMLMADMPDLETADLAHLLDRFAASGGAVIRAAGEDGTPGSPAVIPARLFAAFGRLTGDTGGRQILKSEPVHWVPLPGRRALTDLDTPADWAAFRAR